tara:strand:- start:335 stop:511 length:177 start_codon:yes stop_codon:yes gene_type:complete
LVDGTIFWKCADADDATIDERSSDNDAFESNREARDIAKSFVGKINIVVNLTHGDALI